MANKKKARLNDQLGNFIRVHLPKFQQAIKQAETEGDQSEPQMTGALKLERACDLVNDLIDIPLMPESIEELLFKAVITAIVETWNRTLGKTWAATV